MSGEVKVKTIGAHNGTFHCDEVLAVALLKFLPQYKDAQIVRSRDEEVLKACDVVVDVGGVYDPAINRFDHHQNTFDVSLSKIYPGKPFVTKLSSCGLVYAHFGHEILSIILDKKEDEALIPKLFDKIYANFVEEIDANDNGISVADGPLKFRITSTLSARVACMNPSWRLPPEAHSDEAQMENFKKAMDLVREEFLQKVDFYANDWWDAYTVVLKALVDRNEVDECGSIVELPKGGIPWKEHLMDIEDELKIRVAFVIYEDEVSKMWRVQAVPTDVQSFTSRVPLLEAWRGLKGEELQEISKIPTIQFVHTSGFLGGALDRSDVIEMAKVSLANAPPDW